MGTIANHAIIVTSDNVWTLTTAREKAIKLELKCCEPVHHKTNGNATFLVIPDGSNEGWERSNVGNTQRAKFIENILIICHSLLRYAHRMTNPRVYVDSAYRNKEWQMIRMFLMNLAREAL